MGDENQQQTQQQATQPGLQPATQQTSGQPAGSSGGTTPDQQQSSTQPQTQPSGMVGLTEEQFQNILQTVSQRQEPARQYTMEDFNQAFSVMPIDDEFLGHFGYDEERRPLAQKAYERLRDGIVKQALTMADYAIKQHVEALKKQYAPFEQVATDYQTEQIKREFFGKYPDLEGLDQLALMVRDQFIQAGKKFPTKEAAFQATAEAIRAIVAKLPRQAGNGGQQGQQQQQSATGMSQVSAGGQGGAGSAGVGGNQPDWLKALS